MIYPSEVVPAPKLRRAPVYSAAFMQTASPLNEIGLNFSNAVG
jgi:hypothetical protein